jgi:hypothetical protein
LNIYESPYSEVRNCQYSLIKKKMFSKQIFVYKNNAYDRKNTVRIKNQKSTYFKQLKLNIIALKLFGVMPLTEDENGNNFSYS